MFNGLLKQLKSYDMVQPGDRVYCAVSGGADSVALLWAMYLLREKLDISLCAAHFNHQLRGEESDRDEAFVRQFCDRYEIPLTVGRGEISPGAKGLEAAAREARYAFFETLPGKIATAHTADDNAETVLMHLVRGTGLKGLGGIAPVRGKVIRPMLGVTRQQVLAFLESYHLDFAEDSTNAEDAFLRNRLRHHVMPLLKQENPSLAENVSAMALRLRQDEKVLEELAKYEQLPTVEELRKLSPAVRSRMLEAFLKREGLREPEAQHIALVEELVFSQKPSAEGHFPDGVVIKRNYNRLEAMVESKALETVLLPKSGEIILEELKLRVVCDSAESVINTKEVFTVKPQGSVALRCRQSGDELRLPGGKKTLKKLMIDRKIPAHQRHQIPVIADEKGVLGVYGVGVHEDRKATELPAWQIRFEPMEKLER